MTKVLRGNAYPLKEILKKNYGAVWNENEKCWYVDESVYAEAQKFVSNNESCKRCGATQSHATFTTAPGLCDNCI